MKLKSLDFIDGLPTTVTVQMSQGEALLVAKVLGSMTGTAQNEVMPHGDDLGTDIYDCLVGDVFNRYWEDGVRDAMHEWRARG